MMKVDEEGSRAGGGGRKAAGGKEGRANYLIV